MVGPISQIYHFYRFARPKFINTPSARLGRQTGFGILRLQQIYDRWLRAPKPEAALSQLWKSVATWQLPSLAWTYA